MKTQHNLRKDDSCLALTSDKGVALVIIDEDMYIEKCMTLINDEEVYHECRDQTKSIHSEVLKQLLDLKDSLDQNSKINKSNSALHITTALPSVSIINQKFIQPISPSDL